MIPSGGGVDQHTDRGDHVVITFLAEMDHLDFGIESFAIDHVVGAGVDFQPAEGEFVGKIPAQVDVRWEASCTVLDGTVGGVREVHLERVRSDAERGIERGAAEGRIDLPGQHFVAVDAFGKGPIGRGAEVERGRAVRRSAFVAVEGEGIVGGVGRECVGAGDLRPAQRTDGGGGIVAVVQ